ncbi:hypothetical protein, partial [Actinocorallia lasiicapitis]
LTKDPKIRPSLEVLLDALTGETPDVAEPPPSWGDPAAPDGELGPDDRPWEEDRSLLRQHALALLEAGLTDRLVAEAVRRGR